MSEDDGRTLPRGCRWAGFELMVVVLLLVLVLAALQLATYPIEFLYHAFIGWVPYLAKVVPQITWNAEIAACSVGALALGTLGLQWLMPRLLLSCQWPWRWSFAWCGLLVLLFATSIAAIGVVHQVGWLFRAPQLIDGHFFGSASSRAGTSGRHLLVFVQGYAGEHGGQLPEHYRLVIGGELCFCRLEKDDAEEPWIYLGAGLRCTDDSSFPVIVSPRANRHGQRMLVRLDGSFEFVSEDEFQTKLQRLNEHLRTRGAEGSQKGG